MRGERGVAGLNALGPKSAQMLAAAGITTPAQLHACDAVAIYIRVRQVWPGASMNLLYAVIAAQEGIDWRVVARERRTELLLRLDALGHAPR